MNTILEKLNIDTIFRNRLETFIQCRIEELEDMLKDLHDKVHVKDIINTLMFVFEQAIENLKDEFINDPYSGHEEAKVEDVTDTYNRIEYNVQPLPSPVPLKIERPIIIPINDPITRTLIQYNRKVSNDSEIVIYVDNVQYDIEYILPIEYDTMPIVYLQNKEYEYTDPMVIDIQIDPQEITISREDLMVIDDKVPVRQDKDYLYTYQLSDMEDLIDYIIVCTHDESKLINKESMYMISKQFGFKSKIECSPILFESMDDIAHKYHGCCIILFNKIIEIENKIKHDVPTPLSKEDNTPKADVYYKPNISSSEYSKYAVLKVDELEWFIIMDMDQYNGYQKDKHEINKYIHNNKVVELNKHQFTFYVNNHSLTEDLESSGYSDIDFSDMQPIGIDIISYLVCGKRYVGRSFEEYCYIEMGIVNYKPHSFIFTTSYKNNKAKYDTIYLENITVIPIGAGANFRSIAEQNGLTLLDTERYIRFTGKTPTLNQKKQATKWFNKK